MFDRIDRLVRTIEQDTPADRDRYLDALRVGAILVVVLGHWLARVIVERDGEVTTGHLLAMEPATQWITWLVQVMPLFFIVGGLLNLRSWRRARERGTGAVTWVRNRARRLLRPLVPLLALWVGIASVLAATDRLDALPFDAETAIIPVWFLAAYLVVTALTPVLADRGDVRVVLLLVVGAVIVDALRFGQPEVIAWMPTVDGEPLSAAINYVLVWVAVHQLGFWWNDARVPRQPSVAVLVAVGAVVGLALLVTLAGYPRSMVQFPGEAPTNDAPPTIALFVLGVAQLGVAVALRPVVDRWLGHPRAWGVVALLGSRLMTVFLWHQTAMLAVATLVVHGDVWPTAAGIDARWLALRPLWIVTCAVALVPLVVAFGRFEDVGPPPDMGPSPRTAAAITAVAVSLTSASLGWLIVGGLTDPDGPLGLPILPLAGIATGMVVLGSFGQKRARRSA